MARSAKPSGLEPEQAVGIIERLVTILFSKEPNTTAQKIALGAVTALIVVLVILTGADLIGLLLGLSYATGYEASRVFMGS